MRRYTYLRPSQERIFLCWKAPYAGIDAVFGGFQRFGEFM
jgi:hypothetical protein